MANQTDTEKIQRLNALASYRHTAGNPVTSWTVSNFTHIADPKLAEQVRWTIEGVYQAWSETEHRAEMAWHKASRDRLWSQADALWQDYETLLSDWGIWSVK